jgi:hypothetical protein
MKVRKLFIIIGIGLLAAVFAYSWNRRREDISIDPLKKYAMNYEPCKDELSNPVLRDSGIWCIQPPIPPKDVLFVLNKRKIDEEYKEWVLLIFLKLYEKQLILYNQSFEVRDAPFFLKRFNVESELNKAFCEVIGENSVAKKLGPEFLPASKAYEFIEEHHLFMNEEAIQAEMKLIKGLLNRKRQSRI